MAALQHALPELTAAGIGVVVASTDDVDGARGTVGRLGLDFPVGYGLPMRATAEAVGAHFEERRGILHATGFLLRRDGTLATGTWSSGPIGRMSPEDLLRLTSFWDRPR